MSEILIVEIAARYGRTNDSAVRLVGDLTDQQMVHQANPSTPSVAFHLWHLARYADSVAAHIGSSKAQDIWRRDGLAERWEFDASVLGPFANGTGMESDALDGLRWPTKSQIEDYARDAFRSAEEIIGSLDPGRLEEAAGWGGTVADELIMHLAHQSRHLGMIEAARGYLGLEGTATN